MQLRWCVEELSRVRDGRAELRQVFPPEAAVLTVCRVPVAHPRAEEGGSGRIVPEPVSTGPSLYLGLPAEQPQAVDRRRAGACLHFQTYY